MLGAWTTAAGHTQQAQLLAAVERNRLELLDNLTAYYGIVVTTGAGAEDQHLLFEWLRHGSRRGGNRLVASQSRHITPKRPHECTHEYTLKLCIWTRAA